MKNDEASEKVLVSDHHGSIHPQGIEKTGSHGVENCAFKPFRKLREFRKFDPVPNFDRRGICSRFLAGFGSCLFSLKVLNENATECRNEMIEDHKYY